MWGYELQVALGRGFPARSRREAPSGTTVTVRDLFDNVPASDASICGASGAEASRIADLVSRMALAFPEVQFRLRQDGRETLVSRAVATATPWE